MNSVLERNIQIELYRVFKNLISQKFSYGIEFVDVRFEPTINGRLDLVIRAAKHSHLIIGVNKKHFRPISDAHKMHFKMEGSKSIKKF